MDVQVFFNTPDRRVPIHQMIDEIQAARERIALASAWFTDTEIAHAIIQSSAREKVIILNRADLKRKEVKAYTLIEAAVQSARSSARAKRFELAILGSADFEQGVMHHKFCVIDFRAVWMGSYNFTWQARRNYETLIRIESMTLSDLFWDEAENLLAIGHAPHRLEAEDDSDAAEQRCTKCHRWITPDNAVIAWNSAGDVWCETCDEYESNV